MARALVLGAGIVGVTTAYELWRDGHDVTVIDREAGAAEFTSFGNAGMIAPGHAYAWASPASPKILLRSLWRNDQALRLKPSLDPAFVKWMWKFWGQCSTERATINTRRKVRLCNYAQTVFHETCADTALSYDANDGGILYLFRSQAAFDAANTKADILRREGSEIGVLDADGIAHKDPALADCRDQFAGALFGGRDETGDCRMFARNLTGWLEERGVKFRWGVTVQALETEGDRVSCVVTDQDGLTADIVVLSLGVYSPHLVKPLGIDLPIYPVKGYSMTVPVSGRNNTPAIGGIDEESLVAYTPMGDRLRVTATAEFSGYGVHHSPDDFRHMTSVVKGLFPDGADYSRAEYWAGLRPMTPEGTPILGATRFKNLWMNTGQGHMGWTMSHGTGRLVADVIAGRKPAIPLEGMTL
ncbi:MAG: D-amino acid dehydrogenase [Pseudomonadota bacterium]